jgi:anti-sigma B factor antagonist
MATPVAEAKVRIEGKAAVVHLSGHINRAAEPVLTKAYEEATAAGCNSLLLNFEDTQYINSTGIAVIVGILARARKENVAVTACGLSEHYQHVFEITRLSDFMPMFPDEEAALTNVSSTGERS